MKLPKEIGPHEGKELELILSGDKPLAYFCDVLPPSFDFPEKEFAPHIKAGTLLRREEHYYDENGNGTRCVYFAKPAQASRIEELHQLNNAIFSGHRKACDDDDRKTGLLLGYESNDIEFFIKWKKEIKQSMSI